MPDIPEFDNRLNGLGKGLQLLTQMKFQDIIQQRENTGLQSLGYSSDEGQTLSGQTTPVSSNDVSPNDVSPTYLGRTFDKHLNRIIGDRQGVAGDISEFAYSRLNNYVQNGIDMRTATTQALKDAKSLFKKEDLIPSGKTITNAVVDHFLKKTGNNPEEARRMASEAGYEVSPRDDITS